MSIKLREEDDWKTGAGLNSPKERGKLSLSQLLRGKNKKIEISGTMVFSLFFECVFLTSFRKKTGEMTEEWNYRRNNLQASFKELVGQLIRRICVIKLAAETINQFHEGNIFPNNLTSSTNMFKCALREMLNEPFSSWLMQLMTWTGRASKAGFLQKMCWI